MVSHDCGRVGDGRVWSVRVWEAIVVVVGLILQFEPRVTVSADFHVGCLPSFEVSEHVIRDGGHIVVKTNIKLILILPHGVLA